MLTRKAMLAGLLLASVSVAASAAELSPASLSFQFSGIKYTTTTISSEAGGREESNRAASIVTSDLVDASIWAKVDDFNLYVYPFQDSNAFVSLGYMVNPAFEIGLDLGYNKTKEQEPSLELSRHIFGMFGTYYVPLQSVTLENTLLCDISRGRSVTLSNTTGEEQEIEQKGYFIKATVAAFYPLGKNAWYMASMWFSTQNQHDNQDQSKKFRQFALTPLGFRITL